MIWYDLEIKVLDNTIDNIYKNEYDRSDKNAEYDLYGIKNVKIDKNGFIPFGIIARLFKVVQDSSNEYVKTDSHFWLAPHLSIYSSGLFRGNTCTINKNSNQELKAPVYTFGYPVTIKKEESRFQIVAPDLGWIRNVNIV